jgi:hypothetical protein
MQLDTGNRYLKKRDENNILTGAVVASFTG